ncbi:MAG: ABC transporter ATP-binding protein [Parvibaculum sp.]|nr:ABC transporter ATP-binding protein [Parvibaculum sp.]
MSEGQTPQDKKRAAGYGEGGVAPAMSVGDVAREAETMGASVSRGDILALAGPEPVLELRDLHAGYGAMEILHGIDLAIGAGKSLCIVGPNGAGKSTVLHSIFGFTKITGGTVITSGRDVTQLTPSDKLRDAKIAYILQDNSIFPDMTVEENLLMGGYLLNNQRKAHEAAEKIFAQYDRLAKRRRERAGVLSGGERRLLEISRSLIMDPNVLLVDEPSIGLEPRMIDMVFEILADLRDGHGKSIIMVEQNAKRGLEFADIGYVMVSGRVALAAAGRELLENPQVGRLFLGS